MWLWLWRRFKFPKKLQQQFEVPTINFNTTNSPVVNSASPFLSGDGLCDCSALKGAYPATKLLTASFKQSRDSRVYTW